MDELEQKHCIQDVSSTENFLQRLQQWSKTLPQELRQNTEAVVPSSATIDRELVVAGSHVACTYYFAVILATRRFLTLYLLEQLKMRSSKSVGASVPDSDDKTSSLAFVCLNAAISISKVVHNAIISERVLNNMCLVKYDCSQNRRAGVTEMLIVGSQSLDICSRPPFRFRFFCLGKQFRHGN
jgi:hypothetical protein